MSTDYRSEGESPQKINLDALAEENASRIDLPKTVEDLQERVLGMIDGEMINAIERMALREAVQADIDENTEDKPRKLPNSRPYTELYEWLNANRQYLSREDLKKTIGPTDPNNELFMGGFMAIFTLIGGVIASEVINKISENATRDYLLALLLTIILTILAAISPVLARKRRHGKIMSDEIPPEMMLLTQELFAIDAMRKQKNCDSARMQKALYKLKILSAALISSDDGEIVVEGTGETRYRIDVPTRHLVKVDQKAKLRFADDAKSAKGVDDEDDAGEIVAKRQKR